MRASRTTRLLVPTLLAAAGALLAPPASGGLFGGPTIDGDAYKYDGKGKAFVPSDAFEDGDKFNIISLTNWDMSGVGHLTIPKTVQTLLLNSCKLNTTPPELDALPSLNSLNLAFNQIATVSETFASGTKLTVLNMSQNAIAEFDATIPTLQVLDLTGNALQGVPPSVFQMSRLTALYLGRNLFKLDAVTEAEFDFYAGLSDFQADFVQVSGCANGSELVNLKGARVCRLKDQATSVPIVIVQTVAPPAASATPSPADANASAVVAPVAVAPASAVQDNGGRTRETTFIAYGAVFLLLAVGCIGGLYSFITRRQTARLRGALHEETPLFFDSDKRTTYHQELAAGDKLFPSNDPVLVTWRLEYDAVKLVKRLAKGAFGEVWVGRYRGTKVAVKKLREETHSYEASEDFIREIKLMAWLQHPKVVEFVGVAWTRLVDMLAVNEFMDSGDLRSYLDAHRAATWRAPKLQFAIDAIDAIVYLHSLTPVIIHRDLKSRNVLVDARKGAKLGDFGISAAKRETRDMTVCVGTTRWLAPELARGEPHYTEAVDVYAFGVILAELDTHELPFFDAKTPSGDKLSDVAILQGVAAGTLSVSFSEKCPENLQFLAERCLAFDPKQRPSAAEVAYELRRKDILLGGSSQSAGGGGFV